MHVRVFVKGAYLCLPTTISCSLPLCSAELDLRFQLCQLQSKLYFCCIFPPQHAALNKLPSSAVVESNLLYRRCNKDKEEENGKTLKYEDLS